MPRCSRLVDAMQVELHEVRRGKSGIQARKDVRRARHATRIASASDPGASGSAEASDAVELPVSVHTIKTGSENKLSVSWFAIYWTLTDH